MSRARNGWRLGLLALVALTAAAVGWWFPVAPAELTGEPKIIAPDDSICRERRQDREWVTGVIPDGPGPVTVADVGVKLQTPVAWLCRANEWDDGGDWTGGTGAGCAATPLSTGDELYVPLDDSGIAAARANFRDGTAKR